MSRECTTLLAQEHLQTINQWMGEGYSFKVVRVDEDAPHFAVLTYGPEGQGETFRGHTVGSAMLRLVQAIERGAA